MLIINQRSSLRLRLWHETYECESLASIFGKLGEVVPSRFEL